MATNVDLSEDKYVLGSLVVLAVMLVAMVTGGTAGQIAFSYGTIAFIGLYVLIGTQSSADRHSSRAFLATVAGLVIVLGIGFALLWYFHFQNPTYENPVYWFGFPRATAIVVYLLWMPPALYLMFSYPYLFERYIWNEDQAAEFRRRNARGVTAAADGRGEGSSGPESSTGEGDDDGGEQR